MHRGEEYRPLRRTAGVGSRHGLGVRVCAGHAEGTPRLALPTMG